MLEAFLNDCGSYYFNKSNHVESHSLLSNKSHRFYPVVNNTTVNANTRDNVNIWHHKLGHTNSKAVQQILNLFNIPFNNKKSDLVFHACCLGKSHKLHAHLTHNTYNITFELVHIDL